MNTILEAALYYNSIGWSIIPLSPGSKIPPKDFKVMQYRDRLATKEEIENWWKENPVYNIGIITGKLSNLFVVDLDKYKPEYSEETVSQYIPDNIETVVDRSPRGGAHLYFQYPNDINLTINADSLPGVDYRGEGGYILAPPSVFEGKASEWIIPPNGKPLPPAPDSLLRFLKRINNSTNYLYKDDDTKIENGRQMSSLSSNVFNVGRRDQDLFHLANLLVKGGCEPEFLAEVMNIAAQSCNPPFPQNEVKAKIESAIQRAERKERNITQEITEWILSSSGVFLSSEVAKCLHLSSREEQKHLSTVLKRLSVGEKRIIDKVGNRNGCFQIIQQVEESIIDLSAADTTTLPIKLPLGIHELVKIMPKNIIVVAGESNSGKSAFLLNIAARNMLDHKVYYFSSEMGGAELAERLKNFTDKLPFDMWKNCTFIERANDFDIGIRPNDINIIDFLEIHDEFYKIGGFIKKIFDKLDKGIAVIAIQKNKGRDDGLGGARSIEKARLYLSMRPGFIKIIKAKNWVSGLVNPNGLEKQFKLAKGMIFSDASNWVKADGD
jgi:hypothetical protein